MNLSTQSVPTGLNEESLAKRTESQESSGSKATDDPILNITSRGDALDVLDARNDLTNAQRKHLNRIALAEERVVRTGKPKQIPGHYWERKVKDFSVEQIAKAGRRAVRDMKRLQAHLLRVGASSQFAPRLQRDLAIAMVKVRALGLEAKNRKAV